MQRASQGASFHACSISFSPAADEVWGEQWGFPESPFLLHPALSRGRLQMKSLWLPELSTRHVLFSTALSHFSQAPLESHLWGQKFCRAVEVTLLLRPALGVFFPDRLMAGAQSPACDSREPEHTETFPPASRYLQSSSKHTAVAITLGCCTGASLQLVLAQTRLC